MKQVKILVEGISEETFVHEILREHLYSYGVSVSAQQFITKGGSRAASHRR